MTPCQIAFIYFQRRVLHVNQGSNKGVCSKGMPGVKESIIFLIDTITDLDILPRCVDFLKGTTMEAEDIRFNPNQTHV